jgi:hypothetical protein
MDGDAEDKCTGDHPQTCCDKAASEYFDEEEERAVSEDTGEEDQGGEFAEDEGGVVEGDGEPEELVESQYTTFS